LDDKFDRDENRRSLKRGKQGLALKAKGSNEEALIVWMRIWAINNFRPAIEKEVAGVALVCEGMPQLRTHCSKVAE